MLALIRYKKYDWIFKIEPKKSVLYFQVSWTRRKDFLLLTVGLSTYSSDDRFLVEHTRHLGNWALRIKNARKEDEGVSILFEIYLQCRFCVQSRLI